MKYDSEQELYDALTEALDEDERIEASLIYVELTGGVRTPAILIGKTAYTFELARKRLLGE